MKLVLLGTAGYHPNDHRHTACLMLPEPGVVLDAGTAMYRVRDYLTTDTLDIFLSHAHLDHIVGLTYLFDVVHEKRMRHVVVHGEADKLHAVDQHLFVSALMPARPSFELRPLDGTVTLQDDARLSWFPLTHPGGSVGYRIDWPDRSMAYVTDTMACKSAPYVDMIRGVDVLIHECYFDDESRQEAARTGHSHASCVAEVAKAAEVGILILVHFNPLVDKTDPIRIETARSIFAATEIGLDRMEVEF